MSMEAQLAPPSPDMVVLAFAFCYISQVGEVL